MSLKYNIKRNENGMTIIELLIVIFILSLLIVQLFNVLIWNSNVTSKGLDTQTNQEQFRIVNYTLIEDIMYAKNIVITNSSTEDIISYTKENGNSVKYSFKSDGLYKVNGNSYEMLFPGEPFDSSHPSIYKESSGMVRINYSATKIKSVMYLSIKPRIQGAL